MAECESSFQAWLVIEKDSLKQSSPTFLGGGLEEGGKEGMVLWEGRCTRTHEHPLLMQVSL